MTNLELVVSTRSTDGDTVIGKILQRMFPRGTLGDANTSDTLNSCLLTNQWPVTMLLWKTKVIPVDGTMLATVSTIDAAGRNRWFLMACDNIYIVLRMCPAKRSGCTHVEVAHCLGGAITERAKFEWQQHFAKRIAVLNGFNE